MMTRRRLAVWVRRCRALRLSLPTLMIGRVGLRVTVALSGVTLRSGEVLR
jgi:hypothetical protein